jgi:Cu-Zn family superoxide dismutase
MLQGADYGYPGGFRQVETSRMQKFIMVGALACSGMLAGCLGGMASSGAERAEARLAPTQDNRVAGVVTFTQTGSKVRAIAEVSGLTPGAHGFHIHDKGDCSAPDGTSAGGHFNPSTTPATCRS